VEDIRAFVRIQKDQHLFVDTLTFFSSGGHIDISGYFDGSNADSICFFPKIKVDTINLNQVFYKFDNFGQDYILSKNLSGRVSGSIFGRLQVHADMVPQIENSEFFMKLQTIECIV
jgi:hypothetical protein